jgi:hypothetical protein
LGVASACAVYSAWAQTSPTWFTRIRLAERDFSASVNSVACPGRVGQGLEACGWANSVRKAVSQAISKWSVVLVIERA